MTWAVKRAPSSPPAAWRLFPPAALLAQSHLLGELGTGSSIVRRHHGVIGREIPLLAIGFRRHVVLRAQMTLEGLEFFSILETNDVIGRDRALHRNSGLERLGRRLAVAARYARQRRMDLIDQRREVAGRNAVVADIGRDDFGR